jgi:hypothetical protein
MIPTMLPELIPVYKIKKRIEMTILQGKEVLACTVTDYTFVDCLIDWFRLIDIRSVDQICGWKASENWLHTILQ